MNRRIRRAMAGALAVPATVMFTPAQAAPGATVLAVEGTAQAEGNAQTAFNREFCVHNTCRSINNWRSPFDVKNGSRQLQTAVDSTPGDIVVMGYSLGAATIYDRLREWERTPASAPDPDRVVLVVTYGNPENKFGGSDRKNSYAGLPDVQPYEHLDVTMQYDSVADRPTRSGWYSSINMSFARHTAYFEDVDINDPDNLVHQDEDGSTYMLIKAETLPMLAWMDPWVSDARMAELDAEYRPLIEKDYDRPAYVPQGEGADWGNGNPPPSVSEDESRAVARVAMERQERDDEDADDVEDAEEDDSRADKADEESAPDAATEADDSDSDTDDDESDAPTRKSSRDSAA